VFLLPYNIFHWHYPREGVYAVDFVVIDLETNGLDCHKDQVIEIGAVRISQGEVVAEFTTLVRPLGSIPAEITELTGIDDEMVKDMPVFSEVLPEFTEFIESAVLIGHNIQFDLGFLRPYISCSAFWLDTVEMARILLPYASGYALSDLTSSLNIEHVGVHRALGDARATAKLFLILYDILKKQDLVVLETLYVLSQKMQGFLSDLIAGEYSRRISRFTGEGIKSRQLYLSPDLKPGIFSRQNDEENNENYQISLPEIASLFQGEWGRETSLSEFKYRPAQEKMALQVAGCFNTGGCLVVEAGTGTGKSLAYLLPAALWSFHSGHKVVVSTHTINLQEQLKSKDIPLAKEISGRDITATVIKGRSHYLCLRKWEHYFQESDEHVLGLMMRLVIWLNRTQTGDIDELSLNKNEKGEWLKLAAVSETCLGTKCRFYRGLCFVSRARKSAELSQVIIVNHSLLMANAMANDNILPEYRYLVIDEAHHLEKTAEEQFTLEINYYSLLNVLQKLTKGENPASRGLLDQIQKKTVKWPGMNRDLRDDFLQVPKDCGEMIKGCMKSAQEFFGIVSAFFAGNWSENISYTQTARILPQDRETDYWSGVTAAGENLIIFLKDLIKNLLILGEKAHLMEEEVGLEFNEVLEINMLVTYLHQLVQGLEIVLPGDEENYVCWAEYKGSNFFPALHISPLEVKTELYRYLFAKKTAVVLTSATLTVGEKFNYFTESIGLDLGETAPMTLQLESPFNFQENVLLGIPSDLPDPNATPELIFMDEAAKALMKLITAAQGRTLVLFTSHYQLKQVYETIKQPLKKEGITVYAHGVTGSRTRILDDFKSNERSVLLGANSFWEGIDVVGQALTLVVMVKLPFWSPTIPTVSARLDRYRSLNQDGFRRYSLPQAIIRFRQGFGRLIRSHSDFGAICILDKRIYQKNYGKTFINSLPKMKTVICKTDDLVQCIKEWLAEKLK